MFLHQCIFTMHIPRVYNISEWWSQHQREKASPPGQFMALKTFTALKEILAKYVILFKIIHSTCKIYRILRATWQRQEKFHTSVGVYVTCAISGSETHGWGWYTVYKPSGSYYGTFQWQGLMSYISINFRPSALTWLAVANSNWFSPVQYAWQIGIMLFVMSLLIWTSTREVV